jgi:hypothetical protein
LWNISSGASNYRRGLTGKVLYDFHGPELIDVLKAVSSGKDVYVLIFTYGPRRTLHLKPEHSKPFQLAVNKYEELTAGGTP